VSVVSGKARLRWGIVLAGTALLCALPAIVATWPVPASAISAAALRARVMASAKVAYQGYVQSNVDLGLPDLPDLSSVSTLLDGSTDQYAWYRSPDQWRADQLSAAGEDDIYQTTQGTFLWNYSRNLFTQVLGAQPARLPRAADLLPPALARRLLGYAGRATLVSRLPTQRVAGVDAAGLRLVPGHSATTIGAVDIWADPRTGLPVEVEIFGRGSAAPVLTTRFLDVSFDRPAVPTVTPQPAPGVGFSTTTLPDVAGVLNQFGPPLPGQLGGSRRVANQGGLADVAAYGSGFARFAVLPLPARAGTEALEVASSVGASIPLHGGSAVLIQTPLLTMVLARPPGGPVYLLTGAVTPGLLERAATQLLADSQ
jgi:hypothetical protein